MNEYTKTGYLDTNFKIFHLTDVDTQDVAFHYHDFNKILILLNGDVHYHIEGRSYALQPNDIVFVKAGEVHKPIIQSPGYYERIIIYVSPNYLTKIANTEIDLNTCFQKAHQEQSHVLRIKSSHTIQRLKKSLVDTDLGAKFLQELLFLEFMIELNRASHHNAVTYIPNTASNAIILNIIQYINTHLTEELNIDQLASQFFLSRYYLMHIFKAETGYTIGTYITTKRLVYAHELIALGRPITEVCYQCGYNNYSTFSRAYKKHFGKPPRS